MFDLRLDRIITILRAGRSRNSFNEQEATWNPVATVWAMSVPISDSERLRAGESLATKKLRFSVRHSAMMATVSTRDRLMFAGLEYDINGVKELGRRKGFEITATARTVAP